MITDYNLLWVIRGSSLSEVVSRVAERTDAECSTAFEMHRAGCFGDEQFRHVVSQAYFFRRTDRVMAFQEPRIRRMVGENSRATGVEMLEVSICAGLELYALMVEGFVRMEKQGLRYPLHTPFDLTGSSVC